MVLSSALIKTTTAKLQVNRVHCLKTLSLLYGGYYFSNDPGIDIGK